MDVVTTMLDESIPLTTEYDEWGNLWQEDFDYMVIHPTIIYPTFHIRTFW